MADDEHKRQIASRIIGYTVVFTALVLTLVPLLIIILKSWYAAVRWLLSL